MFSGASGMPGDVGNVVDLVVAVGVVGEDGDVVAGLEAEVEQSLGKAVDAFLRLGVGEADVAIDETPPCWGRA